MIVNKAVVDSDVDKIEFFVNDKKDDWGTVLPDWNRSLNSNYRSVTVEAVRFEHLIRQYGVPYFLKIDIEGADVCCLKGCLKANARPDYVSVELMTPNNLAGKSVDAWRFSVTARHGIFHLSNLRSVSPRAGTMSATSQRGSVR